MMPVDAKRRSSGIEGLGDMSWGTHFCLFYETKEDLLDFFIPFFKVGLEHHEFCLCVASEPLIAEEAEHAMREAFPDFERYLAAGQIEITPHTDWYLKEGNFDEGRVLQGWIDKLDQALARGFAGVRFAANILLEPSDWASFAKYEGKLEETLRDLRIEGLCAYNLNRYSAANVLDVMRHHQFTLARRNGAWESLEGTRLKHAHDEVLKLNADLDQRVIERTSELTSINEQLRKEIIERKRVEEALRESEEKFSAAFRASPVALVIATLDGKFVEMNQAYCDLLGYSREELIGKTGIELGVFTQDARHEWVDTAERNGGVITSREFSFRVRNGISRTVLSSVEKITFHGVPHYLSTILDITERQRAEKALRKSERVLREAEVLGHTGSWEQDLITGEIFNTEENLRLFFGDDRSKGADLEDYSQVVHADDREYVMQRRTALLEEEGPSDIEYRVVWPDGSVHVIFGRATVVRDERNRPIRVYGTNVDITERKQAEEALRESEELYRFLAEHTNDLLILYDLDGHRVYVSPSITRMLGWLPSETFGGIHPEDLQAAKESWQRIVAGEKTVYTFRHAYADGSWRWLEAWGSLVYYRGQPHVMAVSRDITKRKQAEKALQESQERLQVALQAAHIGTGEWDIQADQAVLSDGLEQLLGFAPGTVHASFAEFVERVHPEDRQLFLSKVEEALAGKTGFGMDYRVVWPDGSIHWITAWAHIFYNDVARPIRLIGAAMDITERKQAEQDVRRYTARVEALVEISRTFAEAGLDYQGILNTVAQRTAELIGDSCVITLFSDDGQRSFPVAFHHPNPEARAMMHDALLYTWQGGTDTERYQTLLTGNSIYISTVIEEEFRVTLEPEFLPYLDAVGISSVLIVPLQFQSRAIGTLGITRDRQGSPYTRDDLTLLQNIADRAAMSIQNAQLFRQVEGAREQLGALSRRLLEVQESERRALTMELHDRVGQNLTGLGILLQNIKALLSDEAAQTLATKFDDAQALVEDTTRQIRDIMAELHMPELEDYGLAVALETYAERAASRGNLELMTNLPDLAPPHLPSGVRIALFRAAQEAISNALKHANATQLEISLQGEDGRVRLRVEDDGQGFDPNTVSQKEAPSWGLKIMRERIESIGGKVQIESEPGQGTRVTFEVERPR